MISILDDRYEYYKSLFKCDNEEMRDFLNDCIRETLCDPLVHLGRGGVENIGNTLSNYIFCIKLDESKDEVTYKIIHDQDYNDYFVDGWLDWSLWGDYDKCLKEACDIFESNVF